MEADSTTNDGSSKTNDIDIVPFPTSKGNLQLFTELTGSSGNKNLESQIVERLQTFGLLPSSVRCPSNKPDCQIVCKAARVIDRVQWHCEGCGKRQPVRISSFFLRLQCSLQQALQMMLAWCEDADCYHAAEYFGVKQKVATMIYDKLDELAVKEQSKLLLGGENSVVLAEMYPDCLNRLSPDTTDQAHVHRILMLADTNHIPTAYKLHVIRDDLKKLSTGPHNSQSLQAEIAELVSSVTSPGSLLVAGEGVALPDAACLQQLTQHCDLDMQHFLTTRIWRQAVTLCSASRDLCSGAGPVACAGAVQRYLDAALFRVSRGGCYRGLLNLVAAYYKDCDEYSDGA
ncbi:uncharacterized protein LOC135072160 [Ostrinia nubilalis]|uniref:uncharacterized protein LOC135072160 n=1 Tax=Ostrinia nubilalis TaxID=29057 RepID=UPI003082262C